MNGSFVSLTKLLVAELKMTLKKGEIVPSSRFSLGLAFSRFAGFKAHMKELFEGGSWALLVSALSVTTFTAGSGI